MLALSEGGRAELVVKRSRFIAELMAVSSHEAVRELLRARKEYWSALGITHLVHAFVVGAGANVMGCSDDGEPSGTAGRPVLEVLKGAGITNAMLTVARYFGGIKLGTGGLVKAYSDSAKAVMSLAKYVELVTMCSYRVTCGYSAYEKVRAILLGAGATLESEDFTGDVTLAGTMRDDAFEGAAMLCRDATRGRAELIKLPAD